jgi:hypothetical protein
MRYSRITVEIALRIRYAPTVGYPFRVIKELGG